MNSRMISTTKIRGLTSVLAQRITNGTLDIRTVSAVMTETLGGRDADGTWDRRLAFDLMQVAAGRAARIDMDHPAETLAHLAALMERLPTETRRSERQVQLQQFSMRSVERT